MKIIELKMKQHKNTVTIGDGNDKAVVTILNHTNGRVLVGVNAPLHIYVSPAKLDFRASLKTSSQNERLEPKRVDNPVIIKLDLTKHINTFMVGEAIYVLQKYDSGVVWVGVDAPRHIKISNALFDPKLERKATDGRKGNDETSRDISD